MKKDIVLAGVGGQGILSIANVIGIAALNNDLYLKQAEVHGMSQRGGDVQSNLRLSDKPIASDLIPLRKADIIISMEPMEALRYLPYISNSGWVITNINPFINISNYPDLKDLLQELEKIDNLIAFNMDETAKEIGSPRSSNMVLLGASSLFLDLSYLSLENGIKNLFENKGDTVIDQNIKAFNEGRKKAIDLIKERKISVPFDKFL